jgi:hypothetical protein
MRKYAYTTDIPNKKKGFKVIVYLDTSTTKEASRDLAKKAAMVQHREPKGGGPLCDGQCMCEYLPHLVHTFVSLLGLGLCGICNWDEEGVC